MSPRRSTDARDAFEAPDGFEPPDQLTPDGLQRREADDDPPLSLAPAAAALAVFAILRGLLPVLDVFLDLPRGIGAVLLLAAGASGMVLLVGGSLQVLRGWRG